MKLKNKIMISILIMVVVLCLLPFLVVNLAEPEDGMGLLMILFFGINPVGVIFVSMLIGKDFKKLYCFLLLYCVVFLLSYWLVLESVVLDFIIYAAVYLFLGLGTLVLINTLKKRN